MEYSYHKPCLLAKTLQHLRLSEGSKVLDATLGGVGFLREILKTTVGGIVIGIDKDPEALEFAAQITAGLGQHIFLENADFRDLDRVLDKHRIIMIDAALFDLGVSSHQIDTAERGFSFKQDGPLDMRMDMTGALTAEKIVNEYPAGQLIKVISRYGEERFATGIVREIIRHREHQPIKTTFELVDIIKKAIPEKFKRDKHPAKRTFQALRIEVNGELDALQVALEKATDRLSQGGRIAVISYHSLEDRIVKDFFRSRSKVCECPPGMPVCGCGARPDLKIVTGKSVTSDEEEIESNPRCRSARLRVAEKI